MTGQTSAGPTPPEIKQATTNLQNMMDFLNHVHSFEQDVINEVYSKVSESPTSDPGQAWVNQFIGDLLSGLRLVGFPGAAFAFQILDGFYTSYVSNPPASLQGDLGSVWGRFDATYTQSDLDLSIILADLPGHWNDSWTDPVTNQPVSISGLGSPDVSVPGKYTVPFQQATDAALANFKVSLTKTLLPVRWSITQDMQGVFEAGWTASDVDNFAHGFVPQNPAYYVTSFATEGGSPLCPKKGLMVLENFLGDGSYYTGQAPADLCNWLFIDDGAGTVLNPDGIAHRADVFTNWGLSGSLTASSTEARPDPMPPATPEDRRRARAWLALFARTPRAELEKQLVARAQSDPVFRHSLIRNPRATVEAMFGLPIPDCVKFEVLPEAGGHYRLLLPDLYEADEVDVP